MEDIFRNFPDDENDLEILPNFDLPFEALLHDAQTNVAKGETNFSSEKALNDKKLVNSSTSKARTLTL